MHPARTPARESRTGPHGPEALPILLLMAVTSPWSQTVAAFLARAGHEVHVLDVNDAGEAPAARAAVETAARALAPVVASIHVLRGPRWLPARLLAGALTLRRLARRHRARAVFTLYGGLQAAIAWLSRVRPYGVHLVGSDILLADAPRRLVARIALAGADLVVANGAHLATETRRIAPGVPVQLLYFGIDRERFQRQVPLDVAPRFVCARAFAPIYDNDTIIRALARLGSPPDGFIFRFLADGPGLDASIARADERLGPEMRRRLVFRGGTSGRELVEGLLDARFYVSAAHSDGSSSSLLEALASGLFPILTDIPANREWITHGETGLLFPAGDADALADHLRLAMRGIPWHAAAVQRNLAAVAARGDMSVNLDRLRELLVRAAARTNPAP